ncbi:MAG: hypothetical protein ABII80_03230 [bacterium]
MKRLFQLTLFFTIFSFQLVVAKPVSAQSVSLSITPPVVEILLSPNKKIIQAFTIKNQAESGQFVANLHLVTPIDSEGHVSVSPTPLDPSSTPLLLSLQNADLTFNTPFAIKAGESQQLVISISGSNTDVPLDTYFALVVSSAPSNINSELSSTIPGISSLLLVTLTPDGNLPVSLELTDFDPPAVHDSSLPLTLHPLLHNKTSTMIRTEGKFEVISPRGETLLSLPLYPHLTLGSSSRLLQSTVDDQPSPLSWSPSLLNIGPYRLRLTITSLGGTTIQEIERTVWLLPIRVLIILAIILLTLLTLLLYHRRRLLSNT